MRDFADLLLLAHRRGAQQDVSLLLGQALEFHQDSLGAVDHLALFEGGLGAGELVLQLGKRVEARDTEVEDRLDPLLLQPVDDIGGDAGIDGLKKERIKPILDLCVSRFNAFAKLQDELDRTKNALEERKVIDRAKGILMKLKGLTEEEAYVLMRSTAMREKKKIGEIAQSILTASELLK